MPILSKDQINHTSPGRRGLAQNVAPLGRRREDDGNRREGGQLAAREPEGKAGQAGTRALAP